jgi:hypothetical protein
LTALTAEDHRSWAAHNKRFFDSLGGTRAQWPQWAMPALYYAALHEVQALFVESGIRPANHTHRSEILRHPENRGHLGKLLWRRYKELEQLSRQARYECVQHDSNQLARAERFLADVRSEIAARGPGPLWAPSGVPTV